MSAKPSLLAFGISLAFLGAAVAQPSPGGKPSTTHSVHVGHDVCKTHPNLPQCK